MSTGLVLFCHGARDERWREPFDRLKTMVVERHPGPVELAFLEFMSPGLVEACVSLAKLQARHIVVVPMFLGTGGHLRKDVPPLVDSARQESGVPVRLVTAAGDDYSVLSSLAEYALQSAS